jgi:hypothetical protein
MKLSLAIIISLSLLACAPVPNKVTTEFKTGEEGEYKGADIGFSWDIP